MDHDLGDGMVGFRAGDKAFRLPLVDFQLWLSKQKEESYALLEAVKAKVKADCQAELNLSQCDALLHAMREELESLGNARAQRLTSLRSTAST